VFFFCIGNSWENIYLCQLLSRKNPIWLEQKYLEQKAKHSHYFKQKIESRAFAFLWISAWQWGFSAAKPSLFLSLVRTHAARPANDSRIILSAAHPSDRRFSRIDGQRVWARKRGGKRPTQLLIRLDTVQGSVSYLRTRPSCMRPLSGSLIVRAHTHGKMDRCFYICSTNVRPRPTRSGCADFFQFFSPPITRDVAADNLRLVWPGGAAKLKKRVFALDADQLPPN
jgi:hypothetical protein